MSKRLLAITAIAIGIFCGFLFGTFLSPTPSSARSGDSFRAIRGEKGGQDVYGPYEVVPDWPKPLSQLPGHENWTWGSIEGTFAESPNRIYILQRGELPVLKRPANMPIPQFGPSLSFPIIGVPFRNSSAGPVASPGAEDEGPWLGKLGVDARWEDCLVIVDATGKIIETWPQWDHLFKQPHSVYINPYDAKKDVWIVDQGQNAIFRFTHDGKTLVQTFGTPGQAGKDEKHFTSPTSIAWLPDNTMFVTEKNSRLTKFDRDGKFLAAWEQKSQNANDTRPGYFSDLHGIAIDAVKRRIYVNDRGNRRTQVLDENGKFLDQWSYGPVSTVTFLYVGADGYLWAHDSTTGKFLKYDSGGHLLYSWGVRGDFPGAFWGGHAFSVDQKGNLYVAEAADGRVQKFQPRSGANASYIIGVPVRLASK